MVSKPIKSAGLEQVHSKIEKSYTVSNYRQFSTNIKNYKINTSFVSPGLWPFGSDNDAINIYSYYYFFYSFYKMLCHHSNLLNAWILMVISYKLLLGKKYQSAIEILFLYFDGLLGLFVHLYFVYLLCNVNCIQSSYAIVNEKL